MVSVSSEPSPKKVMSCVNTPERENNKSWPYPEAKAIGIVSQWVNWLMRARPDSPSLERALSCGITGTSIWTTMDAVM